MRWRLLAWAATLALTHAAEAFGAGVLSVPEGSVTEATVVVAAAPARTTRWVSLRLGEKVDRAVVLVPVRPSARVDVGSTAFLEALDDAMAPRIVPPPKPSTCGLTPSEPERHVAPVMASREPTDRAWLPTAADVLAYAKGWQIEVPALTALRIEALEARGFHFVAATYASVEEDDILAPLRVVDDAPADLPLFLLRAGNRPVRLLAYAIGPGRASLGDAEMVVLDGSDVLFDRKGRSSYPSVLEGAVEAGAKKTWVVESAGHDAIFSARALPRSTRSIPSLVRAYLSRVTRDETTALSCESTIAGLANRPERVGHVCHPSHFESGDCADEVLAGEIDPGLFRCEDADDLALALSGQRPGEVVVTRATSVLLPFEMGADLPIAFSPGVELSPVLATSRYEPCESGAGGGTSDRPGGGSSDPWTPPPLEGPADGVVVGEEASVDWEEVGCVVVASSASESCSSDYDDEDEGDESCDSDQSDGYESDESCGADESSGYESDDSCGSDGGTGAETAEECAMARSRRRPFRPRLSAFSVSLAAIALFLRRLTRKIA